MSQLVLLVESDVEACLRMQSWLAILDPQVELYTLQSLEAGAAFFAKRREELKLVVMSGKFDLGLKATLAFIQELRRSGFEAPIMAAAASYGVTQQMKEAGCTVDCDLRDAGQSERDAEAVVRRILTVLACTSRRYFHSGRTSARVSQGLGRKFRAAS